MIDYKKLWLELEAYLSNTEDRITKNSMVDVMKSMELSDARSNDKK